MKLASGPVSKWEIIKYVDTVETTGFLVRIGTLGGSCCQARFDWQQGSSEQEFQKVAILRHVRTKQWGVQTCET